MGHPFVDTEAPRLWKYPTLRAQNARRMGHPLWWKLGRVGWRVIPPGDQLSAFSRQLSALYVEVWTVVAGEYESQVSSAAADETWGTRRGFVLWRAGESRVRGIIVRHRPGILASVIRRPMAGADLGAIGGGTTRVSWQEQERRTGVELEMNRRRFLQGLAAAGALECTRLTPYAQALATGKATKSGYKPGRISNDYSLFLPGEREALASPPLVSAIEASESVTLHPSGGKNSKPGHSTNGWTLLATLPASTEPTPPSLKPSSPTAEPSPTSPPSAASSPPSPPSSASSPASVRGPRIRLKSVLSAPPPTHPVRTSPATTSFAPAKTPVTKTSPRSARIHRLDLRRQRSRRPRKSIFLQANGVSRGRFADNQSTWSPDTAGPIFDPTSVLPGQPEVYAYQHGYSKRTLLAAISPLPTSASGIPLQGGLRVHRPHHPRRRRPRHRPRPLHRADGHPPKTGALHQHLPRRVLHRLAGIWNHWHNFYEIPCPSKSPTSGSSTPPAPASPLTLQLQRPKADVSNRRRRLHQNPRAQPRAVPRRPLRIRLGPAALEPHARSRALLPVLPRPLHPSDGNFLYNTQDQVEAPLNAGVFFPTLPVPTTTPATPTPLPRAAHPRAHARLRSHRYEYSKTLPCHDARHGLIWGSPEADLGDPRDDDPQSHPYYFQNAT